MGKLYLVGTPIGNLEDITFRAVKTLQTVDLIAAEDTRHTGKLLQHFQISTPQISYHQHNRHQREIELINKLKNGENIALVTDAGMPGISDPGYDLVKACIAADIEVMPIPGVTAAITALVAAGLPTEKFVFEGFLPSKAEAKRTRLKLLSHEERTIIFYESPHRLIATLASLAETCGEERQIAIARELTKIHEEFWRGTLKEAIELYQQRQPKGEYTLCLAGVNPATKKTMTIAEIQVELAELIAQGMTRSQASRYLAKVTGLSRREIYQLSVTQPNNSAV